jgi:hypothetical protein
MQQGYCFLTNINIFLIVYNAGLTADFCILTISLSFLINFSK